MRPFVENFPFFSIFLTMTAGILLSADKNGRRAGWVTLGVALVVAVLSAAVLVYTLQTGQSFTYAMGKFPAPFGNELKAGPWQALTATVFSLVVGLSLLGGRRDLEQDVLPAKQNLYFVMVNLVLASLLTLGYTNDLFTSYVFIEISTIAACALVMARDTGPNLIATLRYLFLSLMGSGLFLIGVAILYTVTGHLLMPQIAEQLALLRQSGDYALPLLTVVGLIATGLGVKSAMFPFHMWLPDAHGSATTASSAILSGLVLKGYIVLLITLLLRVFTLEAVVESRLCDVLLLFGLLGMVFGSVRAIQQTHIKRMLAYSSVAQIGYIFMGLGLGTEAGIVAACLHILVHAVSKPMLFCCAGKLGDAAGHHKNLYHLKGSAFRAPLAGVGFTVGALSMVGIPLLGGFASKLYFATASIQTADRAAMTLLVLALSTVLNALYYVPAMLAIWTKKSMEKPVPMERDWGFTLATSLSVAAVFALGIWYLPVSHVIELGLRLL